MIVVSSPSLPKYFRFPQHIDDLLCSESFSRDVCLPCEYSNGSSLTLKVDSFLGGRSLCERGNGP